MTDDRALRALGLARRGGNLAVGEEPVAEACKSGRARAVLLAADAADNTAHRGARLAEDGGAPLVPLPYDKGQVGFALGRSSCALLAVTDAGLAALILAKLAETDSARYGETAALLAEKAQRIRRRKKERGTGKKKPAQAGPAKQPKHEP